MSFVKYRIIQKIEFKKYIVQKAYTHFNTPFGLVSNTTLEWENIEKFDTYLEAKTFLIDLQAENEKLKIKRKKEEEFVVIEEE